MRGFVASVLVVAGLALAGCTGDPEPRFSDPTDEPSSSAPTSSAAAEPEPWQEKSKDGAVAFARHWIDVFNAAQASGKTKGLRMVSTTDCQTCNGFMTQLETLYGSGGRFVSDGWEVLIASPGPGKVTDAAQVNIRIDRPAERLVRGNGTEKRFAGGKATYSAELVWRGQGWQMSRLVRFV